VASIISGKLALKYSGRDLEAMQAVAKAGLNRSLSQYNTAINAFQVCVLVDIHAFSRPCAVLWPVTLRVSPWCRPCPHVCFQELSSDAIVRAHLGDLRNTMLEQNLLRILEPFSRVEVQLTVCLSFHLSVVSLF
jgi:26S proteasome regulatory subunit N6